MDRWEHVRSQDCGLCCRSHSWTAVGTLPRLASAPGLSRHHRPGNADRFVRMRSRMDQPIDSAQRRPMNPAKEDVIRQMINAENTVLNHLLTWFATLAVWLF